MLCGHCGSTEVCRDATATWSVEEQKWELAGVQDQGYCELCDGEASLKEVELDS